MKKQINPTIKAHLIRGAFYLLLLLAVCAIPFAMGQRNTKKNVIRPGVMPPSTGAATGTLGVPDKPHSPNTSTLGRSQPHSFLGSLSRLFARPGAPNLSPWTIVADYPVANESPAVASDGTFAYSAGGINDTSGFHLYDPVANTWTALPNVPTGIFATRAVYAANTNSVYVFGGIDASFVVQNLTQIYNVGTGTWSNGTPMPDATGRYFPNIAYNPVNGKIYVIGGFDGATFSEQSQTWEYDPVTDTWDTSRAPIPVPMGGAGASIVGQNIYLAGGWNDGAGNTAHYRYDIVANTWTATAPVPVPIYEPAAAGVGTNTYLIGGGNPDLGARRSKGPKLAPHPSMRAPATSYTSTYIYDTVADSWTTGPNANVAHSFTGGTAIGTQLLVVTGFDGVS